MKILELFGNRKFSNLISNKKSVTKNTHKMVELKINEQNQKADHQKPKKC